MLTKLREGQTVKEVAECFGVKIDAVYYAVAKQSDGWQQIKANAPKRVNARDVVIIERLLAGENAALIGETFKISEGRVFQIAKDYNLKLSVRNKRIRKAAKAFAPCVEATPISPVVTHTEMTQILRDLHHYHIDQAIRRRTPEDKALSKQLLDQIAEEMRAAEGDT